jgi:hypothetical protein
MYKIHIWKTIVLFCLIYILIIYLNNKIIFNDLFYYLILSDKFSIKNIEEVIVYKNKYEWLTYILSPSIILIKYILVTILVFIGIKLFELNITFENCFRIVLLGELIPILSSITKTLYFYIYPPSIIELVQNFNPLGLISLLKHDTIPKYLIYLLQQLNLFEVGYWLLLAYGIKSLGNVNFKKALKITSLSYGVGLLIWCIFIVFLQLQFS